MKADSSKITGIVATIVIHALVVLLLFTVVMQVPAHPDESGMEVTIGDVNLAKGTLEDYRLTEVNAIQPQDAPTPDAIETTAPPVPEEPIIAQETEETVVIETAEQIEARKRAEAEKKAAEAAAAAMANAFGKSTEMTAKGTSETIAQAGTQGSVTGNAESASTSGSGRYGTYDLGNRTLEGALPKPTENVQDEGTVVVAIVVNPAGDVISANISLRTKTSNPQLRQAALNAAKKARFNAVEEIENQTGSITYYFKLQ